jgi:anaerobic ribonucleoside-triphosphate reductase activating protein
VRIHAIEPASRANGPGVRFVVWVQGCTLGCPGCFNPGTHEPSGGQEVSLADLLAQLEAARVEGLTISGGEPFQQIAEVTALLAEARRLGLSTLVFSGYTLDEIRELPGGTDALARIDVLIDGRYLASDRLAIGLRGSRNQRIQLLSDRHARAEVEATPVAEIRIGPAGDMVITGVDPLKIKA